MSLIKISIFYIRSFKYATQSNNSLAMGKKFYSDLRSDSFFHCIPQSSIICVVIFFIIDHEFRRNVLRTFANRYIFSMAGWCQEIIHHGFLNAK
jgi:hypothetical protein